MKKAKIMLLTIAVITTVGTALAFKVSNKVSDTYCYLKTTIQPSAGGCTDVLTQGFPLQKFSAGTGYFYTIKPTATACNSTTLACTSQGNAIVNE